jgi:iron(III) transport system ATP-binding protein
MADRIAVLNLGRLEQFDTPETIYHMPSTPFVADFVGQADFLPGRVRQDRISTEIWEFPNLKRFENGAAVVVMVRPNHIHIVPDKAGMAHVVARQFKGSENLYTLQLPSGQLLHCSEGSMNIYPVGMAVSLQLLAAHTVLVSTAHDQHEVH